MFPTETKLRERQYLGPPDRLATGRGCVFEGRAKTPREVKSYARRGRGCRERGKREGSKIKGQEDSVGP